MNLKDLSQLYYLNREIEADMERLARLKAGTLPSIPVNTGMPVPPGIADKTARYAAEISDLRRIIEAKQRQCMYERIRLERYIADIPDSLTRQIFTLRFVNGLRWDQVSAGVGGNNTEAGVKMICYRYIKANN